MEYSKEDTKKTIRNMLLVIPGMVLCMIGDYCIGIEPADSKEIGVLASSGWLTISDLRIAISNIGGLIGTIFYCVGAHSFMKWLIMRNRDNKNKWDQRFLKLYYFSLCVGCASFIYFHLACGGLIQHYNVLYEVSGNQADVADAALMRMFLVEAVPFLSLLVLFDGLATVAWIGLVVRKVIKLPTVWIVAAPLLMALVGQILEFLPLPFQGIGSGFESLGWMLMFVGGALYVREDA